MWARFLVSPHNFEERVAPAMGKKEVLAKPSVHLMVWRTRKRRPYGLNSIRKSDILLPLCVKHDSNYTKLQKSSVGSLNSGKL